MTTVVHYVCVHCGKVVTAKPGRPSRKGVKANDICGRCMAKVLETA